MGDDIGGGEELPEGPEHLLRTGEGPQRLRGTGARPAVAPRLRSAGAGGRGPHGAAAGAPPALLALLRTRRAPGKGAERP
mmetsp:Transcript_14538/g.34515  ORF Transcript_14538/g.34515 Transcript_14538/m.34515 type:complete len:80 (+) Transcript_14538:141-380(+)